MNVSHVVRFSSNIGFQIHKRNNNGEKPYQGRKCVKLSVVPVLFGNIKIFILGKNLMNIGNVEKPLELLQAFACT